MEKRIGKRDILLLLAVLAGALCIWAVFRFVHRGEADQVKVTVDGSLYGTYDLRKEQTIKIKKNGKVTNTLVIRNGKADMTDADCPDLLCVHQKAIQSGGETIVCLPNKVVVEVVADNANGKDSSFDTIAK